VNNLAWAWYYVGRGLELMGLLVVLNGLLVSVQSPTLWPLLYFSVVGFTFFFVGWVLARRNPER